MARVSETGGAAGSASVPEHDAALSAAAVAAGDGARDVTANNTATGAGASTPTSFANAAQASQKSDRHHLTTPQQSAAGLRSKIEKLSPGTSDFLAAVTALSQGAA